MKLMTLSAVHSRTCPASLPVALGSVWAGGAADVLTTGWATGFGYDQQVWVAGDGTTWTVAATAPHTLEYFRAWSSGASDHWVLDPVTVWRDSGSGWAASLGPLSPPPEPGHVLGWNDLWGSGAADLWAWQQEAWYDVTIPVDTETHTLYHWSGSAWDGGTAIGRLSTVGDPASRQGGWKLRGDGAGGLWGLTVTPFSTFPYTTPHGGRLYRLDGTPALLWEGNVSPVGETRQEEQPRGLAVISATDLILVTARYDLYPQYAYDAHIRRWNGTAWSDMGGPPAPSGSEFIYLDVSAVSASDVWVVGYQQNVTTTRGTPHQRQDLLAAHWNGTAWARHSLPGYYNVSYLEPTGGVTTDLELRISAVHARAADDVWVVGTVCVNPDGPGAPLRSYVAHYDGSSWTEVPIPES